MTGGYRFGLIVEVSFGPRPINIVKEYDATRGQELSFENDIQLIINGVPIVITVDQYAIEWLFKSGQHFQAKPLFHLYGGVVTKFALEITVETRVNDRNVGLRKGAE